MRRATILATWGLLAVTAGAPTTMAQEAPATGRILLEQLTAPVVSAPADSLTRDDLQALPPPRMDRVADSVRFTVVASDPLCLPGEAGRAELGRVRAYPRRR